MNKITFPSTVDVVMEALIVEGHDAGLVRRTITNVLGTSFTGAKVTQTAYNKIESIIFETYKLRTCDFEIADGNRDDPSYMYCGYAAGHAGDHGAWRA